MQIGTTSPFSQSNPLANALKIRPNESDKTQEANDVPEQPQTDNEADGEAVKEKDPIETLRDKLNKENEPSALEKLRSQIAQNVVEKFQTLQQKLNPQEKDNKLLPSQNFLNNIKKAPQQENQPTDEEQKEEAKNPETPSTKPGVPQNGGNTLEIKDFNLVPMTNFEQSTSVNYEATYNKETGEATQEMMYSHTYNFTFSGTVVDKNGNKHNIEANVTLTRSVYTKITGGSDTLDPKVLEELQKGNPFNFAYEGDGSDLKDQDFSFLLDNEGAKDQISSNDSIFGDLVDKAFGEGLGSLLEGLRIFASGGKENAPTTLPAEGKNMSAGDASKPTTLPSFNNPFDFLNPPNNRPNNSLENLIGLGEQGIGMIFFTQFQAEMLFQTSSNGNSFNTSFSYSSTSVSFFGENAKDKNTLEAILERQKLLAQKDGNDPADVKKALNSYKNTETPSI